MKLTVSFIAFLSLPIFVWASNSGSQTLRLEKDECQSKSGQKALYGAECGHLTLPENPNGKNGRELDVYVMRLPSIRDINKTPIFFIAGGPGQAATEHANNFRHMLKKLQVEHDFVFVDQRGTGKSNPLNCDFDPNAHSDLSPTQVEAKARQAQRECVEHYNADLTRYTTPYAVKDLEEVRRSLGYDKIFLWGGSYGTRVILEYLRSYPQVLAGVVLDGVAPVTLQLPFNAERDASIALAIMLDNCASLASCNAAFPNLKTRWQKLLQELNAGPAPQTMQHPRTEVAERIYIDDVVVSAWVRFILYSREISPILPLALHQATKGDFSILYTVASLSSDKMTDQISEGMQLAVLCAEDLQYHKHSPPPSLPYERLLHMANPEEFASTCELFPKGDLPKNYFTPVKANIPALLLSGQYDPATPPFWGEHVKNNLTIAKHIIAPGGHHIISGSGCVPELIADFVKAPTNVREIDDSCVNKIRPNHYFIDTAGPSLPAEKVLSTTSKNDKEDALMKEHRENGGSI